MLNEVNQPYFSFLTELRKLGEIFFAKRLLSPCFWIDPGVVVDRSNLHFFNEISSVGLRASFI